MTLKQKTAVRREQIAQAALEELAEHGPAELSLAPIAARLGLSTSAIYRHFSGKEAILDAVVALVDARLAASAATASRTVPQPLARLEFLLQRHVELVRSHSGIPRLLFSWADSGGDGRQSRLFRLIHGYLGRVAKIVREGQRVGVIRADVDSRTLAVHFLGIMQPAVILGHLSGGRFDVVRHAKLAWPLFLAAASPREEGRGRLNKPAAGAGRKGGSSWKPSRSPSLPPVC